MLIVFIHVSYSHQWCLCVNVSPLVYVFLHINCHRTFLQPFTVHNVVLSHISIIYQCPTLSFLDALASSFSSQSTNLYYLHYLTNWFSYTKHEILLFFISFCWSLSHFKPSRLLAAAYTICHPALFLTFLLQLFTPDFPFFSPSFL